MFISLDLGKSPGGGEDGETGGTSLISWSRSYLLIFGFPIAEYIPQRK